MARCHRLPQSAGSPQPIQKEAVYRIDAPGQVEKVADEPFKPNGLCISPDYKKCYVADTGISRYPNAKSVIWVLPEIISNVCFGGTTGCS
jgi:gluconolactonase